MTAFKTVQLGDQELRIERASGRKANRALALMRAVSKAVPEIVHDWGQFVTEFERNNVVELDRVQARLRFPRQPIYDENDEPMRDPETGEILLAPSRIDAMTEADWEQAGGRLRLPRSPSVPQQIAAVLPGALEKAEDYVYKLVALFTISNAEVKRHARAGDLDQVLTDRADELLDDYMIDELLELGVVVGEVIDEQLRGKLAELGDRVGNALRLLGLGPAREPMTSPSTSSDGPPSSTPASSTASPANTDGPPTPHSTSPTTSSELSERSSEPSRTPPTPLRSAMSASPAEPVSPA